MFSAWTRARATARSSSTRRRAVSFGGFARRHRRSARGGELGLRLGERVASRRRPRLTVRELLLQYRLILVELAEHAVVVSAGEGDRLRGFPHLQLREFERFAVLGELLARDRHPVIEPGEHDAERAHAERGEIAGPGAPRGFGRSRCFAGALIREPRLRLRVLEPLPEGFDLPLQQRAPRLRGLYALGRSLGGLAQAVSQRQGMRPRSESGPCLRPGGECGAVALRDRELGAHVELAFEVADDQLEQRPPLDELVRRGPRRHLC